MARSLELLKQRDAALYRQLCLAWGQLELAFTVTYQEPLTAKSKRACASRGVMRLRLFEFVVEPQAGEPERSGGARIETSVDAMLSLIEGTLQLRDALYQERLRVFASPAELQQLGRVLTSYLAAAVRQPDFVTLHHELTQMR